MTGGGIAFCFPGQGSLEVGMGRELAEAVPEAMDVFTRGSEASGLDLMHLCFEAPESELVQMRESQDPSFGSDDVGALRARVEELESEARKNRDRVTKLYARL